MTAEVIFRKLRRGAPLTALDEARVTAALTVTRLRSHAQLFREGDTPDGLIIVLKGVACRHKNLRDGGRQIVALLVPGDICDVHAPLLNAMDHGMATLGKCTVAHVPRSVVATWMRDSSPLRQAMNWSALTDEATLREWLVNLGARSALERMAHLFCELLMRMEAVGESEKGSFALEMTQEELGQTLGLSVVHVNRTLACLRREELLTFARGKVRIPDVRKLHAKADFRSNYLHLDPSVAQYGRAKGELA